MRVFVSLALLFACSPLRGEILLGGSLYERSDIFPGRGNNGPYPLSASFVEPGSDSLLVNGEFLESGVDYRLDPTSGNLTFYRRVEPADTVEVHYRAFPIHFRHLYARRSAAMASFRDPQDGAAAGEEGAPGAVPGIPGGEWHETRRLKLFGSKSVGFTLGGGGFSLDQSLHASISGQVAEGWEVRAELSDQSLPFQPEGTTEDLEELDRIYIELESRRFNAVFGDFAYRPDEAEFFAVERKLEGVSCRYQDNAARMSGAAAVSPGRFNHTTFYGREGVQGPYELPGADGETGITVVAGTERIWVDGELQTRGSDNDYTISYDNAEITFTPWRLVTSESRIVADYEYVAGTFRKQLYSGSAGISLAGGALDFDAIFFSEEDDTGSPVTGELDEAELDALAAAGDDPSLAFVSGATASPDTTGDYSVGAAGSDTFYVYTPGEGAWQVVFNRARYGAGDYTREIADTGGLYYEYAGSGNGDYLPVVYLSLPGRTRIADLRMRAAGGPFSLSAETAFSINDPNVLSGGGGGSGEGGSAVLLEAAAAGEAAGGWRTGVSYKRIGETFATVGRVVSSRDDERWNEQGSLLRTGIEEWRVTGLACENGLLRMEGETAVADHDNGTREERYGASARLGKSGQPHEVKINASQLERSRLPETSSLERFFRKLEAEAVTKLGPLSPRLKYDHERRIPAASGEGVLYREYETGCTAGTAGKGVELDASATLRDDFSGEGWEADEKTARSWTTSGGLSFRLHSTAAGRCEVSHRERETFGDGGDGSSSSDLVRANLSFFPLNQSLRGDMEYELSGSDETRYLYRYVAVDPDSGTGLYRFDDDVGAWFRDADHGTHRRIREESGDSGRLLNAGFMTRLNFSPARYMDAPGFLKHVSCSFSLDLSGKTEDPSILSAALLRKNGYSVSLNRSLDGRIDIFPLRESFGWGLFVAASEIVDRIIVNSRRDNRRFRGGADVRWSPSEELSLSASGEAVTENEIQLDAESWETTGFEMDLSADWSPRPGWRFRLGGEGGWESIDYGEPGRLVNLALLPSIRYSPTRKTRIDAGSEHSYLVSRSGSLPVSFRGGKSEGLSHELRIQGVYGLGRYTEFSAEWQMRVEPDYPVFNEIKAELTAYF